MGRLIEIKELSDGYVEICVGQFTRASLVVMAQEVRELRDLLVELYPPEEAVTS